MSGNSEWFKERPYKKRRYNNDRQDFQSQIHPNPRFHVNARPPQGPRYNCGRKYSSPRRVEYDSMERSTSEDLLLSPCRTSSEGSSASTNYLQSQGAHSDQGYDRRQNASTLETNSQSHYSSTSLEPEGEQSTQGHTNDVDDKDNVIDDDLYDTASLEKVLPMANSTLLDTGIEQDDDGLYSNDSVTVMVTDDDAPLEVGMQVDDDDNLQVPVPTVGDHDENDQDWEVTYGMEDDTEVTLSAAQSAAAQLQVPANTTSTSDSKIFGSILIATDDMSDVTANPWTTS